MTIVELFDEKPINNVVGTLAFKRMKQYDLSSICNPRGRVHWRYMNEESIFQKVLSGALGYEASLPGKYKQNAENTFKEGLQSEEQRDIQLRQEVAQEKLDAVLAAQDLKLQGKSLDTLSESQQKAILEATGKYKLSDVTSSDLSDAAGNLNGELSTLASSAAQAAEALAKLAGFSKGEDGNWYYTDKETGTQLVSQEVTDSIKSMTDAEQSAKDTASLFDSDQMEKYASACGMAADEFEALRQSMSERSGLDLQKNAKDLNEITMQIANYSAGLEDLRKISKSTWTQMKKDISSGTVDGIKNIASLKETISKTFNTDMSKITDQFVEDHLDALEKMSTGTADEVRTAEETIQDDLVKEVIKADKTIKDHPIKIDVDSDGIEDTFAGVTDFFQNAFVICNFRLKLIYIKFQL